MRARIVPFALVAVAAFVVTPSAAEPPAPTPAPAKPATDWKNDSVCRMVFFAVLEGLYTDGVPDAVVDGVVPRHVESGADPLAVSFVVQCPLCHPVYEAFAVYQKRPALNGDAAGRSTFGPGVPPELVKSLSSTDPMTRLKALHGLVQTWVERRLTAMRLTADEKRDWTKKLGERSREGKGFLSALIRADPRYRGWSMYWGCAACNGTTDACRVLARPAKPE